MTATETKNIEVVRNLAQLIIRVAVRQSSIVQVKTVVLLRAMILSQSAKDARLAMSEYR
jgi:hypothetical protein